MGEAMQNIESIRFNVDRFMQTLKVHENTVCFANSVDCFQNEMCAGLAGSNGSLLMIPSYVQSDIIAPQDKKIIAIDAGGTNLRVAVVYFDKSGQASIEQFKKLPMPGTSYPLNKDQFFEDLAGYIGSVHSYSDDLGVCFSFPCRILPNLDGEILGLNKEVVVSGIEGAIFGEELNKALEKHSLPQMKIALINDTVATLLGAMVNYKHAKYDGYIGYILGTGTNACYQEKIDRIEKLSYKPPFDGMIINLESGGFSGFQRSQSDTEIDALSNNPSDHQFEKMVSGAYLGQLILRCMNEAAKYGLYSTRTAENVKQCSDVKMKDVDAFVEDVGAEN